MMIRSVTSLGLLVAGCFLLNTAARVQGAPKKSADVVVHSLKVHTTKKDGDSWDAFKGAPDLFVFIRQTQKGGAKHTTKLKEDTFEASFGERTIWVSVGDEIEVIVYDKDVNLDDKVGEKKVKITEEMLKDREVKWEFGRVITLVLEFEP